MSRLYNILSALASNAIISQTTSGNWTMRKYADGTGEMWGTDSRSVPCTISSPAYGGYRSDTMTITIPSFFTSIKGFSITKINTNAVKISSSKATSNTTIVYYASCGSSETSAVDSFIRIIGRWK